MLNAIDDLSHLGGMTHASLSRIERGLQPYSQSVLEAIADELTDGDVACLLVRDPSDPDGIWSIWERAKTTERRMIVDSREESRRAIIDLRACATHS